MPVYPDKDRGKLTGRWRVELQRKGKKYRQRHDSHEAALEDEKRVQALWEAGEDVEAQTASSQARENTRVTLAEAIEQSRGILWADMSMEDTNWRRVEIIADIIGPGTVLDHIDTIDVDKIRLTLKRRGKTSATANRYCSCLRTFLVYCYDRRMRSVPITDQTIKFAWAKEEEGRIRWITFEEEDELMKHLPDNIGKLVKVAIATGCRRDELLTAKLDQVNGHRFHIWKTKTRKARTVPMSPETTRLLRELLEENKMPTQRNLRSWWNRAREAMDLVDDPDFVFHACRHTCATRLLEAGVNVVVIKEWLGHKRIETTLRYAHVKSSNLDQALTMLGDLEASRGENSSNPGVLQVPQASPSAGEFERHAA